MHHLVAEKRTPPPNSAIIKHPNMSSRSEQLWAVGYAGFDVLQGH